MSVSACAHRQEELAQVTRIDVQSPLTETVSDGGTFAYRGVSSPHGVSFSGMQLERMLAGARCHSGTVLWKGGVPATLLLQSGERIDADGFSYYGHFLRVNDHQWCELTEEGWAAIWEESQ